MMWSWSSLGSCFRVFVAVVVASAVVSIAAAEQLAPIIVVETVRGMFEIETYPSDAPKTVAHVVGLVQRGFYDGQRVHRALPGFVAQWGDPRSRDISQETEWGRGAAASSGSPLGVAEMNRKRTHTRGAVAMAHQGDPARADSQIFVTLADRPDLNGRYVVFGQVVSGDDVPARLERGDLITRMYVK
jgi:peptidyl-prolyl cis-trans isomerase B (cyclophilin B)